MRAKVNFCANYQNTFIGLPTSPTICPERRKERKKKRKKQTKKEKKERKAERKKKDVTACKDLIKLCNDAINTLAENLFSYFIYQRNKITPLLLGNYIIH